MTRRNLLFISASTVFLWGISFPLTKWALAYTGPTAIAFLRWSITAILLLAWIARRGELRSARTLLRTRFPALFWMALTGITLFYFLENVALQFSTATNAGVLANLTSVFLVLLGTIVLHERLAAVEWGALAAAFLGAVLVSQGSGHLGFSGPGLIGDGLMVVASFFGAVYSIAGKGLVTRNSAEVVTTLVAAIGAVLLLPLALWEGLTFALPWQLWGLLVLLGLGCGALGNVWWLQILGHLDAARSALILFLVPIVSTGLAVALLGEKLTPGLVVGGILVIGGVLLVQLIGNGQVSGAAVAATPVDPQA